MTMDCLSAGSSENGFDDNGVKYAYIQASWVEIAPSHLISVNDPNDCHLSQSDVVPTGNDDDESSEVANGKGKSYEEESIDNTGENIAPRVFPETVYVVDNKETRQLSLEDQYNSEQEKDYIIKKKEVKNVDGERAIILGEVEAKEAGSRSGRSVKDGGDLKSIVPLHFWSILRATKSGQIPVSLTIGILLFMPSVGTGVGGTLASVPVNTLVAVGETVRIKCSIDLNQPVYWARTRVQNDEQQWLYYGSDGFDITNADVRFSIAKGEATGRSALIISDVQPEDAGRYTCFDESGLGSSASAELVVSDPIECNTRIPTDGAMGNNVFGTEQDLVQISCSLSFTGNLSPTLEWSWPGSETQTDQHNVSTAKHSVTSTLKLIPVREHNGHTFQCRANIEGAAPHTVNSAHLWESEPINVKYAEFVPEEVDVCPGVELSLACNPACFCSFEESKDHQCRCMYTYYDKRTQVHQIALYATRCEKDNDNLLVVWLSVVIGTVVATVIGLTVTCFLKKKKTKRLPESAESCGGNEAMEMLQQI